MIEHFFRHEYARLVAILSCRVGVRYLEDTEDAVQSAIMLAMEKWAISGAPDNPEAWLFRVAYNNLMGELRQRSGRDRILEQTAKQETHSTTSDPEVFLGGEVSDHLLRMLFVCCDEALPVPSSQALALKILCGFKIREIALLLFTSEANIYKRLGRARKGLRELPFQPGELSNAQYVSRLATVHQTLYLLFTEGYLSSQTNAAIRRELCQEAIRLATLLAEHPWGKAPETFALLALMHLHLARMTAREDPSGGLLLLEEQNREHWDQRDIQIGLTWLGKSAWGNRFSRYHAEAGIAAEHCLAPSFHQTCWRKVVECYELLEQMAPSALHRLNRAVAVAEWQGPQQGLAVLKGFEPPTWLAGSHLWHGVLADLHRRCGNTETANRFRETAIQLAPTAAVKKLLLRRLMES